MSGRIRHAGTERNWEVVGLTPDNFVRIRYTDEDQVRDTQERPSEFHGITYLTQIERGIIGRGVTPAGRDRKAPRR